MKKKYVLLFLLVVVSTTFIYLSCNKTDNFIIDETLPQSVILAHHNTFNETFVFPVGTKLEIKNNELFFQLPHNYALIAKIADNDGNTLVQRIAEGSVTCKCTEGSGCNPYILGDQSGCSTTGSCTKCEMTIKENSLKNQNYILIDGQVVNFNQDYQFLLDKTDYQKLTPPKPFIFEDEKVLEYLNKLLAMYNTPEDGLAQKKLKINEKQDKYIYVPVNFLGIQILATFNKKKCSMTTSLKMVADYSCKCNSGSSGCTYGSSWTPKGKIHYCEAEQCTSCTLSEN